MSRAPRNSPTTDVPTWPASTICTVLGLSSTWQPALIASLPPPDALVDGQPSWSPETIRGWQRAREVSSPQLRTGDLRLVALRMQGFAASAIAPRVGLTRWTVQDRLRQAGLSLALRHATDRAPGSAPGRAAAARLASKGYPNRREAPVTAAHQARRMWEQGHALARIGAETQLSTIQLSEVLRDSPARWRSAQVTNHLGWSPDNINAKLRHHTMPPPDGVDGRRRWWWPRTILDWESHAGLVTCPDCGARVKLLPQHQRVHGANSPNVPLAD